AERRTRDHLVPGVRPEGALQVEAEGVTLLAVADLRRHVLVVSRLSGVLDRIPAQFCLADGYVAAAGTAPFLNDSGVLLRMHQRRQARDAVHVQRAVFADEREVPARRSMQVIPHPAEAAVPAVGGAAEFGAVVATLLIARVRPHRSGVA